jgi:hypothetical protein
MPIKYVLMHAAGADGAAGGGAGGGDEGAVGGGAAAGGGGAGGDVSGGAAPVVKPVSMDETIRAALAKSVARNAGGGEEDGAGTGGARPAGTGTNRDPQGRFAKAAADAAAAAAAGEPQLDENGQPIVPDPSQQAQVAQPTPYDKTPNGYKKDSAIAKGWANFTPEQRKEMHEREGAFHEGIKQYKQAAHFGSSIAEQLVPYAPTMKQHNRAPADVVKELGAAWNTLVAGSPQEKAQMVLQILQDYSIDLASLGQMAQQPDNQRTQDSSPIVTALQQRIDKLEGTLTAQERQRAEAEFSATVDTVNAFGNAVDKAGKPMRPHYQAVKETMANLIESGVAKDLDDAYEQACWARKDIRDVLIRDQEAERVRKQAADAAAARRAGATNVVARGAPPMAKAAGKIDDTIRNKLAEIRARGG